VIGSIVAGAAGEGASHAREGLGPRARGVRARKAVNRLARVGAPAGEGLDLPAGDGWINRIKTRVAREVGAGATERLGPSGE